MNRESANLREHGPERRGGQGLDPHQYDSGDATILALLAESPAADHTDLVITWRAGAYEVWSRRGMIRFKRFAGEGGALSFEVVEQIGENPVANQDPFVVATIDDELDAAARSGNRTDDPNRAYFEPDVLSHPYAYERIAQLFDSPRAPDLVVSAKAYAWGIQPGQHGALDVVQCRAPLVFSGPGVRRGLFKLNARHVDIAPTIARMMGFAKIAGLDASGAPAEVYLKRQDGRSARRNNRRRRPSVPNACTCSFSTVNRIRNCAIRSKTIPARFQISPASSSAARCSRTARSSIFRVSPGPATRPF